MTFNIVSHRISTLDFVDCIYMLKNGTVVEWVTYNDLIASHSRNFSRVLTLNEFGIVKRRS